MNARSGLLCGIRLAKGIDPKGSCSPGGVVPCGVLWRRGAGRSLAGVTEVGLGDGANFEAHFAKGHAPFVPLRALRGCFAISLFAY
jgi:hypothetical protein